MGNTAVSPGLSVSCWKQHADLGAVAVAARPPWDPCLASSPGAPVATLSRGNEVLHLLHSSARGRGTHTLPTKQDVACPKLLFDVPVRVYSLGA